MTRKYKTSYKSHRSSSRFAVTFDAPTIAAQVEEKCTICGGKIEAQPMLRGVCYDCYRSVVNSFEPQPENLGTYFTISGGEVMELDAHLESQYELTTEEDMPF